MKHRWFTGRRVCLPSLALLALAATASAQYSSNAGAPYTIYLDMAGFTYNGTWAGGTPGTTAPYSGTAAQQQEIWARVAEKYAPFGVNVTTLDPAIAAGQAGTDAMRQAYYDNTAQMMHTVIGGNGSWFGGGGGVSYVGVTQDAHPGTGFHTNWVFAEQAPSNLQFIGEGSAHENGHGLKLNHHSVFSGSTLISEYDPGSGTGNGSYAPIMGYSYVTQRGTWASGIADVGGSPQQQNDPALIQTNNNIGNFTNDGIGHTLATASALSTIGNLVNFTADKGIIVPTDNVNPNPIGVGNYTQDFFKFHTGGGAVSLTAWDGGERITPGMADPGATLDSNMLILDGNGVVVGTATRDASTLFETFSGALAAGNYYVDVQSVGGFSFGSQNYYSMGSFFLTGNIAAVPEPAPMVALGLGAVVLLRRRKGAG